MKFFRLIHINVVLLKHGLDEWVGVISPLQISGLIKLFLPWRWFRSSPPSQGQAIREALIELGPIFVKFGQLLSTRRDLLPDDWADELALLQDKVPPFDNQMAIKTIEQSFNQPIETIFKSFEKTPLASASIAQVHGAITHEDQRVVVKVLRPNIHKMIRRDVALLETLAQLVERYWPPCRRFKPTLVVKQFKRTLLDELDFLREAGNASQLHRNFKDSDLLHVPEIYWPLTKKNVLVMERVHGIPIANVAELKAKGTNLKVLAQNGVEIFFTQVFRDCFFHADMHPGNIFVDVEDPEHPKYIAVDFGIMGTLSPQDQQYLAANLLAFLKRDYRRVAQLHIESGWVPPQTRVDEFESAIRTVCEPIFERPLKDISFGHTLLRLFQTASRFNMELQPQLILLQKTLVSIEGLGRQLYPDLDLWNTAKPFLEQWMKNNIGPSAIFRAFKDKIPQWTSKLHEFPDAFYDVIRYFHAQTQHKSYHQKQDRPPEPSLHPSGKGISKSTLLGSTLMICASILALGAQHPDGMNVNMGSLALALAIAGLGGFFFLKKDPPL